MSRDHPLSAKEKLRLYECTDFPLALPVKSFGLRSLLDAAAVSLSLKLTPVIEADNLEFLTRCVQDNQTLAFRLSASTSVEKPVSNELVIRPLVDKQLAGKFLTINQLKDRTLSVATARFIELLALKLK